MDARQLAEVLHRIEQRADGGDYRTGERLAESYAYLTELVADKDTTIESLRKLLKPRSEKTSAVLGGAVKYMRKHWRALTLFLREPGAPLDNNICEGALKRVIVHRRNSLFYKTRNGAAAGDCLMSLIYTCELNRVQPFNCLTALQDRSGSVEQSPCDWLPWCCPAALTASSPSAA